jgi:hypothetical protein
MLNLRQAVVECGEAPRLVAKIVGEDVVYLSDPIPQWLDEALPGGRIPGR